MKHHHTEPKTSWVERTSPDLATPDLGSTADGLPQIPRQSFHNPHTSVGSSLGIAGHLIHMAGVFIPVIAGELVQDATKYKKTVRLASIGTAAAYEILYMVKEHERQTRQAQKLADCRGRE